MKFTGEMDYSSFDIKDFINDDFFIRWVITNDNFLFWEEFIVTHPYKQAVISEARTMVLQLAEIEKSKPVKLDADKIWDRIITQTKKKPVQQHRRLWENNISRIAASLLLLAGLGWGVWQPFRKENVTYNELVSLGKENLTLIEKVNGNRGRMKIELADGSTVILEKNSRISFPSQFNSSRREVFLSGDAFFEVTKNPSKPFYVYANEIVTKVLGTSFGIQAGTGDREVVVNVKTGRVSVFKQSRISLADPERSGIVLLPNQEVVYNRTTEKLNKKLVQIPLPIDISTVETVQRYDEVSVAKLLGKMEEIYGVKLIYSEEALSKCVITITLGNESIYDKLELICSTIGATYKEVDAQIVIETNGCH
jgi:transmembrane sensor